MYRLYWCCARNVIWKIKTYLRSVMINIHWQMITSKVLSCSITSPMKNMTLTTTSNYSWGWCKIFCYTFFQYTSQITVYTKVIFLFAAAGHEITKYGAATFRDRSRVSPGDCIVSDDYIKTRGSRRWPLSHIADTETHSNILHWRFRKSSVTRFNRLICMYCMYWVPA